MKTRIVVLIACVLTLGCKEFYKNPEVIISEPVYKGSEVIVNSTIVKHDDNLLDFGHCWATDSLPDISDQKISMSHNLVSLQYSSTLTNLDPEKTYYVRAYVISTSNTVFSESKKIRLYRQLYFNGFNSTDEIISDTIEPLLHQTSYLIDYWAQAGIADGIKGGGLFINGVSQENPTPGANFFALNTSKLDLTPQRGAISFWFKYKFSSDSLYKAYFFNSASTLTGHFSDEIEHNGISISAGWDGGSNPVNDAKYFFFEMKNTINQNTGLVLVNCNEVQNQNLYFDLNTIHKFDFIWDQDGINNSDATMKVYINGIELGHSDKKLDTQTVLDNYLYLGTTPGAKQDIQHFTTMQGVFDELRIYNTTTTNF